MNTANAKELELGRGVKAEAARRLNKSPQWIGEAWAREVPEVVDMILQVVQDFAARKAATKGKIKEIAELQTEIEQ